MNEKENENLNDLRYRPAIPFLGFNFTKAEVAHMAESMRARRLRTVERENRGDRDPYDDVSQAEADHFIAALSDTG